MTDLHPATAPGPLPLADRRLARFLFKLVQQPDGYTWMLPTRRMLTLHLLFGRIGYPEPVLRSALTALAQGLVVPYRHPYEIPQMLVTSMFPLPFGDELPLISWLRQHDVLFLYDEEPISEEQPRYGLDTWLPRQWLGAEFRAHPESAERTLARYGDDEDDLHGYESVVSTASATAAAIGGFPAFLLPAIAVMWTASFAPSLHAYAVAEQLMLERLPRRLFGFGNVAELTGTDAAAALRHELRCGPGEPRRIARLVERVADEVRRRGIGYRELILGRDDLARISTGFEPVANAHPGQAVMKSLADSAVVRLHTASAVINGFEDAPELLLVPGPELWVPPLDVTYLTEIYARLQFGGRDGTVQTYAPA